MIMSGVYSNFVLFACLLACVSGSELVRNKRQWPYSYDTNANPYGACGKPTTPIPHGGIKLFPITDFYDQNDNSCNTCYSRCPLCEPKFYCNDGYEKKGVFRLDCVQNSNTRQYEWEGSIPHCEEIETSSIFIYAIPALVFPGTLVCFLIRIALRSSLRRNGPTRTAPRTGLRSTTIHVTPASRAPGERTLDIPRVPFHGPAGYSRFDDSNVNVAQDETVSSRYDTEVPAVEAVSSDAPPPSYTQALQIETADPASTSISPTTTAVDSPAAIIATT
ncbi:uncharacterized protein LOC115923009 [Strongylocentrotus purpuratus]|uniref:Uncharacterized protein n=1 Tax=Strongylocentrotus purpuratus TaxID=7668 RepID=A0A7M7NPY3_STRPU|nr:uncharacterized protein LOC115923009 [Strongylocentrotus purpuratus]